MVIFDSILGRMRTDKPPASADEAGYLSAADFARMRQNDASGNLGRAYSVAYEKGESTDAFSSIMNVGNGICLAGKRNWSNYGGVPLYRSVDYGHTWAPVGTASGGCTGMHVYYGDVNPATGVCCWGTGDTGNICMLRSDDFGETFAKVLSTAQLQTLTGVPSQSSNAAIFSVIHLGDGTWIANIKNTYNTNYLIKSVNDGLTWTLLEQTGLVAAGRTIHLCSNGDLVYQAAFGEPYGVYISEDGGTTWALAADTSGVLAFSGFADMGSGVYLQGTYKTGTAPLDIDIWRSPDYGATWSKVLTVSVDSALAYFRWIQAITSRIAIAFSSSNESGWTDKESRGYITYDAGLTWGDLGAVEDAYGQVNAVYQGAMVGTGVLMLATQPNSSILLSQVDGVHGVWEYAAAPNGVATLDANGLLHASQRPPAGTLTVTAHTETGDIAEDECGGGVSTNTGASEDIELTLPAAVVGYAVTVYLTAAYNIDVIPDGTDQIVPLSGTPGGTLSGDATIGSYLHLVCMDTGKWHVLDYRGTWGPPADLNTVLLLHCNAVPMVDSSFMEHTIGGSGQVLDETNKALGSGSVTNASYNLIIDVPNTDNVFDFSEFGEKTVEAFFKFNSLPGDAQFLWSKQGVSDAGSLAVISSTLIRYYGGTGTIDWTVSDLGTSVFHHIAIIKGATGHDDIKLILDGVEITRGSGTITASATYGTTFRVGNRCGGSYGCYANVDEVRVSLVARNIGDMPPTEEYSG
jgi:hypothetical protein